MERAVKRGEFRRGEVELPSKISAAETPFQRRHESVTVVTNNSTGVVLHASDNREKEALSAFYENFRWRDCRWGHNFNRHIAAIYLRQERKTSDSKETIASDKFYIAQSPGKAVDRVRRAESKNHLEKEKSLRTAEAWAIKKIRWIYGTIWIGKRLRMRGKDWYKWAKKRASRSPQGSRSDRVTFM